MKYSFSTEVSELWRKLKHSPTESELSDAIIAAAYEITPADDDFSGACMTLFSWALRTNLHGKDELIKEIVFALRPEEQVDNYRNSPGGQGGKEPDKSYAYDRWYNGR